MKKLLVLLFSILLFGSFAAAQRTKPAEPAELEAITLRGRLLAEYDIAAWHSTDAVVALSPKKGSFDGFIGRKTGGGWTVVYGRLSESGDKYLIAYEAVQQSTPVDFKVTTFLKPKEDTAYFLKAAKALDASRKLFVPAEERPYNVAVLSAGEDRFHVYFIPAQTVNGIFPLGGDVRYTLSSEANVLETRQLHKAIIEFKVPEGVTPDTGYHTAILDELPEDTDVFHVLAREPKVPELVVSSKFVYQIAPDGAIRYLMTTEAFKKIGQKQ